MLANKKTVGYRHELNLMLPQGEEVAAEIAKTAMSTKMADQKRSIENEDHQRLLKCQKLFEPLYQRSTLTGGELAKQQKVTTNPLYETLRAQKEEREYYLALV